MTVSAILKEIDGQRKRISKAGAHSDAQEVDFCIIDNWYNVLVDYDEDLPPEALLIVAVVIPPGKFLIRGEKEEIIQPWQAGAPCVCWLMDAPTSPYIAPVADDKPQLSIEVPEPQGAHEAKGEPADEADEELDLDRFDARYRELVAGGMSMRDAAMAVMQEFEV